MSRTKYCAVVHEERDRFNIWMYSESQVAGMLGVESMYRCGDASLHIFFNIHRGKEIIGGRDTCVMQHLWYTESRECPIREVRREVIGHSVIVRVRNVVQPSTAAHMISRKMLDFKTVSCRLNDERPVVE